MTKTILVVEEMRAFLATQKVAMASEWVGGKHLTFYAIPDGNFVVLFGGETLYSGAELEAAVGAYNTMNAVDESGDFL